MKLSCITSLLSVLTVAATTIPASAQKSFDLILPTAMEAPVIVNGVLRSTHVGLLVNTGTVPILLDELDNARFHSRSSMVLKRCEVTPSSGNWTVLQPGEAVGSSDPIYQKLLQPHESVIANGFGAYFVRTDAAIGSTARITTHLEIGARRSRSEMDITWVANTAPFRVTGVQRISGVVVPLGVELFSKSCGLPGYGPLPISLGASFLPAGGTVSPASSLPVIGNHRLVLSGGFVPGVEIGQPWATFIGGGRTTANLLGCDLIVPFGTLGFGVVALSRGGRGRIGSMAFAIPSTPSLTGSAIGLQTVMLTPNAANGIAVASPAMRMNLISTASR